MSMPMVVLHDSIYPEESSGVGIRDETRHGLSRTVNLRWNGPFLHVVGLDGTQLSDRSIYVPDLLSGDDFETVEVEFPKYGLKVIVSKLEMEVEEEDGNAESLTDFVATLITAEKQELGYLRCSPSIRTLTWGLKHLNIGQMNDHTVPGGMPMTPDTNWLVRQSLVFWLERYEYNEKFDEVWESHCNSAENSQQIPQKGSSELVVRQTGGGSSCNTPNSVTNFYLPSPTPDCMGHPWPPYPPYPEPTNVTCNGCNGLHFLDETFIRSCCDNHDRCYQDPDGDDVHEGSDECSASSWIFFWRDWRCTRCNIAAVTCFVTMSLANPGTSCVVNPPIPEFPPYVPLPCSYFP